MRAIQKRRTLLEFSTLSPLRAGDDCAVSYGAHSALRMKPHNREESGTPRDQGLATVGMSSLMFEMFTNPYEVKFQNAVAELVICNVRLSPAS